MDFRQLKLKYKDFEKGIKRKDLADNLGKHLKTEINAFAEESKLDFGQALNLYSPPDNENRPQDAILDCIAYRDLRTIEQDGVPASPCANFFDEDDVNFALGVGYLQNIFGRTLGCGIDRDRNFAKEYINSAANVRSILPRPFNPEYTGELETRRNFRPRVKLVDIIAMRRTIMGDQYEAPIVEGPTDTKLRPVGEDASMPRYKIDVAKEITRTSEIGYELEIADKVRRSQRITMDAIAEVQMWKARQVENAIVNEFINDIANGAKAIGYTSPLDSGDIINLHLQPDDEYVITTIIGTIGALVEYANADIFYQSSTQKPFTPRSRSFIDEMMGNELIAKKSGDDVPQLSGGNKFVCFDRMCTYDYIVEQGGTIQETYRENRERTTVIQNAHNFAGRKRAQADQCRWLVTIS